LRTNDETTTKKREAEEKKKLKLREPKELGKAGAKRFWSRVQRKTQKEQGGIFSA